MKKFYRFFVLLLIFVMVFAVSMVYGCSTPENEQASETTSGRIVITNDRFQEEFQEISSPETDTATNATAPQEGISCILGYWEVEPESLKHSANAVLGISNTNLFIQNLSGSIIYEFYKTSGESESAPSDYRMNVWWGGSQGILHITSVQDQEGQPQLALDMWVVGIFSSYILAASSNEIHVTPIPDETHIRISACMVNGQPFTSAIDMSDLVNSNASKIIYYECIDENRISLQVENTPEAFFLFRTNNR